ncbi:MAG: hypothetical protein U0703_25930 [Anaerolineae bacterium]
MTALSHLLAELGVSGKVALRRRRLPAHLRLSRSAAGGTRRHHPRPHPRRRRGSDDDQIPGGAGAAAREPPLANLALRLLQRYTKPGLTETEVERRAGATRRRWRWSTRLVPSTGD